MKVVFDLDGTLIDVRRRYFELHRFLVPETPLSLEGYWKLKQDKIPEAQILERIGKAAEGYEQRRIELIEAKEFLGFDTLRQGALEVLDKLSDHELYAATSRRKREHLLEELDRLGIKDRFKRVYSSQDYPDKTHMDLNIKGVYIGDTEQDVLLARKNSSKIICVLGGLRSNELLEKESPDYLVELEEVPQIKIFK